MPALDQNLAYWNEEYAWSEGGDEWSSWWGGTPAIWYGTLLPRLHTHLPAGSILEIAPGHGRCTQYLKDQCERLVIVDLAERCIEHCRQRFGDSTNIEYHVNDGRSLEMVADGSIDLVFSFDSLVHVEMDILEGYLEQLAKKLTPDGVGFLHHSNIGGYRPLAAVARRTPEAALAKLVPSGALIDIRAWRAETVTADRFAECCSRFGLACITQEKISWEHGRYLIDAFSVFTPAGSRLATERRVVKNPGFGRDVRRFASLYAAAASRRSADPSQRRARSTRSSFAARP